MLSKSPKSSDKALSRSPMSVDIESTGADPEGVLELGADGALGVGDLESIVLFPHADSTSKAQATIAIRVFILSPSFMQSRSLQRRLLLGHLPRRSQGFLQARLGRQRRGWRGRV